MLSGIGPAEHLERFGVDVQTNLPGVGENLQDHLFLPVSYSCTEPVSLSHAASFASYMNYALFRRGMLTSNVAECGGFVRTRADTDRPNLQYLFGPAFYLHHALARPTEDGFSIGPTLLRPVSRGRIRLRTTFPMDPPSIEPDYLSHDADVEVMVAGIELARRIAAANAFKKFCGAEFLPGKDVHSRAEIANYVREAAETTYHPVGTCKMGDDPMAVVDSHLRVRGVERLRVVDASIMPTIITGNTNAPVIMIAEKAADFIRSGN